MQILPAKELSPFIRHYLFLRHKGDALQRLRLFSDGHMGIVFSFKGSLFNAANNWVRLDSLPGSFLYGQIYAFKDICLEDQGDLAVVVFQPTGVNRVMGLRASELKSNVISVEDVFGRAGHELYEKLSEQESVTEKVRLLNEFFLSKILKRGIGDDGLMRETIAFIQRSLGRVSSSQLVKYTGYTERQVERKFQETVGMGPKKFCNIVRLHQFLKELKNREGNQPLTSLAYEAGYADQSHLIREFKAITGMTPRTYQGRAVKLASNFLSLNNSFDRQ